MKLALFAVPVYSLTGVFNYLYICKFTGGDDDDDDGIGGGLLRGAEDFFGSFFESDTSNKKKKPSPAISIKRQDLKKNKFQGTKQKLAVTTETSDEASTFGSSTQPAKNKEDKEGGVLDELEEAVDEYDQEEEQVEKQEDSLDDKVEKDEEEADEKESEKEDSYEDEQDDDDDSYSDSDDEYNEVRGDDSSTRPSKGKRKKTKSSSYGLGFLGRVLNFFY